MIGASRWLGGARWPSALVLAGVAVGLGVSLPWAEHHYGWRAGLAYDASTAQSTLAAIAGGMITLTGFVFTAVTLLIQTVQSPSPRLLRALDRTDRSPLLFGVFTATFTFALVVLSRVRADAVPGTSVTLAIVFVLVSVALFLRLLVTLRAASTVGGLTRTIGNDLRTVIERHYPLPYAAEDDAPAYDGPSDGEEWKYTRSDARKRPVHPW